MAEIYSQIKINKIEWKLLSPLEENDALFKDVKNDFSTLIIPV